MAASTSTSADPNNSSYDVFISHRGPDVKKTLASHLYRRLIPYGLRVFLDYEELKVGENLTPQIEGAIASASVQVAIFSPGYAGSNWCLDELLHILKSEAPIIPIFYGVKPADLRWTHDQGEGVYARALDNLAKKRKHDSQQPRYNSTTIENWRNALSSVPETSGLDLEAFNGDEGMLLDKVIESVLKRIKKPQLNVAKYPTGLDGKVQDFEKTISLKQHSERVEVVGIAGFGGVGKTTLAKELFNRKSSKYGNSCFLFHVRGNAGSSLVSLQNKLLSSLTPLDLRIQSVDQGIEMLRKHLSSSHVLIVLDDVDNVAQVEALLPLTVLGPGSLILITSRDKDVLARSGIQQSSIYELTGLDAHHSKDLFCSYAFCQSHPPSGFESLVHRFLEACKGLPLSLKVLGGLLNGNTDKSYWEAQLVKVQNTLPQEIQKSLQISYDALDREEKQIFLDIACFFVGERRDTAINIWEGSGWNGSLGFRSLQQKCLVELDIENKIIMHDHLIDLGRDLAKESGLPRRLWRGIENIDDFMQQSSGITHVRGFRYVLNNDQDDNEIEDDFALFSCYKIKKLELLDIASLPFQNLVSREFQPFDPEILVERILTGVLSPKLIWLRWRECHLSSLPFWIPMKNLLVLEAHGTEMKTLWQTEKQAPLQLLELRILAPLSNIPVSIGQLSRLERIVVDSGNFEKLPEEFGRLLSLKTLVLKRCSKMRYLPDSFGNLRSLEHIELFDCTDLERLPNSFMYLIRLKYLDLSRCHKLTISSDTFRNISTFEYMNLDCRYDIEALPLQIAHQQSLETLNLKLYCLTELPSDIGELRALEKLLIKSFSVESLPPSIGDLRNLKCLVLQGFRNLKCLPDSIRLLNQLTQLTVQDCSLPELPFKAAVESDSENLTQSRGRSKWSKLDSSIDKCMLRLEHLDLRHIDILNEVSINEGVCPNLQHLLIESCNNLVEVGLCGRGADVEKLQSVETSVPLEVLRASMCVKLKRIRGLVHMTKLRELDVSGCSDLEELPGVEHLKSLEKLDLFRCVKLKSIRGLEQLTQLRTLNVYHCFELEELPSVEHLRSLEELNACGCVKLNRIRGLEQLTRLRTLNVGDCFKLEELSGAENLRSLEKLDVFGCVKLKSIQGSMQMTKLRSMDVSDCSDLEELLGIEHLRYLEKFDVSNCVKLKSILGLEKLTQLRTLNVCNCSKLEELPGVEYLRSLEKLDVSRCVKMKSIRGSAQMTKLQSLDVSDCSELEELPGVEHSRSLGKLDASRCVKLKRIRGSALMTKLQILMVYGCSELEELDVSGCVNLVSIEGLEHLRKLQTLMVNGCSEFEVLDLSGCVKLKSILGLAELTEIRRLKVSGCSDLEELPGVENMRSLEYLDVSGCVNLKSIPGLAKLPELRTLKVAGCSELEELDVSGCVNVMSIEGLRGLTELQTLMVIGCSGFEVLDLSGCVKLKIIPWMAKLTELRTLKVFGCSELEELDVSRCVNLVSIEGLEHSRELQTLMVNGCSEFEVLDLSGCVKLKSIQGMAELTELRTLKVSCCSNLEELPGVESMRSLEYLDVSGCVKLKSLPGLAQLTELRTLNVSGRSDLEELPGVDNMRLLEYLLVSGCVKLKSLPGLAQLTELRTLHVSGCSDLEELPGVDNMWSLEYLDVSGCVKLKSLPGLAQLTELGISDLEELPGVDNMRSLKYLDVSGCVKLKSLPGLAQLTELGTLRVSGCSDLEELPGVDNMRSLKYLDVSGCVKLKSLPGLAQLTELRTLHVSGCSDLEELPGVDNMMSLECLDVSGCVKLKSLPWLAQLTGSALYTGQTFPWEGSLSNAHHWIIQPCALDRLSSRGKVCPE